MGGWSLYWGGVEVVVMVEEKKGAVRMYVRMHVLTYIMVEQVEVRAQRYIVSQFFTSKVR